MCGVEKEENGKRRFLRPGVEIFPPSLARRGRRLNRVSGVIASSGCRRRPAECAGVDCARFTRLFMAEIGAGRRGDCADRFSGYGRFDGIKSAFSHDFMVISDPYGYIIYKMAICRGWGVGGEEMREREREWSSDERWRWLQRAPT